MNYLLKLVFVSFLLATIHSGFSQDILIPYRIGELYGLSNVKGKIVVEPKYDQIFWVQDHYFKTVIKQELNDTLKADGNRWYIRNESIELKGLLFEKNEILKDEPFRDFKIYPNKFIIGSYDGGFYNLTQAQYDIYKQEKFTSLFDLNGRLVENFRKLYTIDEVGQKKSKKTDSKYMLFGTEQFDGRNALFRYDIEKQKIHDWLLTDVKHIYIKKQDYDKDILLLEYYDIDGQKVEKILNYGIESPTLEKNEALKTEFQERNYEREYINYDDISVRVEEVEKVPPTTYTNERTSFKPYYEQEQGNLVYIESEETKTAVSLSSEDQLCLRNPSSKKVYGSVIYKRNNGFGIISEGQMNPPIYDSIYYYSSKFLVKKKIKDIYQYGLLNDDGSVLLAVEFDSIHSMKKLIIGENRKRQDTIVRVNNDKDLYSYSSKRDKNPYVKNYINEIIVWKNGVCGLFDGRIEKLILPIEYNWMAQNGLEFIGEKKSDFMVLKKDNRYDIIKSVYSRNSKSYSLEKLNTKALPYIPFSITENYYESEGLDLLGLYDENFKFRGYARKDGFLYFKD
ncbi:MAG: WG repeat-containing protein [Aquaticitalea sp.]